MSILPVRAVLPDAARRAGLLAAVLGLAAVLRVIGLQYGLPDIHNPDEIAIMSRALAFAKGDFNPHNFLYPTLYFYVLFAWIGVSFAAGWLAGLWPSLAAFQTQFFLDPTYVYTSGRLLSVLMGVATVAVTYRWAHRTAGTYAAAGAAAFLAVAPFAVRDAHYVKHDVPVTLAVALAMVAFLRWMDRPGEWRRAAWSGVACGVACSTHYYAVFLLLPLGLIPFIARGAGAAADRWRAAAIAAVAAAVVFVALSPYLLVDGAAAWNDIVANRRIVVDRAVGTGLFASAGTYVTWLASEAAGWPVAGLALVGLFVMARRDLRLTLVLASFPVAFVAFISNTVPATRYLNPVLPFVAVCAGQGLAALVSLASARAGARRWMTPAAMTTLIVLASLPGTRDSVRTGLFFRETDTRTLAARYIRAHVAAGATVLTQAYTVQLTSTPEAILEAVRRNGGPDARPAARAAIQMALSPYPSPAYRVIYLGDGQGDHERLYLPYERVAQAEGLEALKAEGVAAVAVRRSRMPASGPALVVDRLERGARLAAVFSPFAPGVPIAAARAMDPFVHNADARIADALVRPGPVVEVWVIDPAP